MPLPTALQDREMDKFDTNMFGQTIVRTKKLVFDATDAESLAVSDFVGAHLYAGNTRLTKTTVGAKESVDVYIANATDFDIRDLTATTDSVSSWVKDGAGISIDSTANALHVHIASHTGTLTVSDAALANTSIDNAATTIGSSATKVVTSDLSNRKYLFLYNNSIVTIFLGKQSGLSTSNGFPFQPGVYLELRMGAAIELYGITAAIDADCRNLQVA